MLEFDFSDDNLTDNESQMAPIVDITRYALFFNPSCFLVKKLYWMEKASDKSRNGLPIGEQECL